MKAVDAVRTSDRPWVSLQPARPAMAAQVNWRKSGDTAVTALAHRLCRGSLVGWARVLRFMVSPGRLETADRHTTRP